MPSTTKLLKIIFKSAPVVAFCCPQPTGELHIMPPASALPALLWRNSAIGRGCLSFRLEQHFCKAQRLRFSVNHYYFNVCITGEPKSFSLGKGPTALYTYRYVVDTALALRVEGRRLGILAIFISNLERPMLCGMFCDYHEKLSCAHLSLLNCPFCVSDSRIGSRGARAVAPAP